MCGIAGILHFDGSKPDIGKLELMTDTLAHRGPDGRGTLLDGPVGLGHRRLSIIDLSDQASQPMLSADGSVAITFNGEIYNYKELADSLNRKNVPCRTNSDTEVIIRLYQLYGFSCLNHLRGMFSFAIWDKSKQLLFLARDRVGIKPLYYFCDNKRFVFGSEIKSIAATGFSDLSINNQALASYFRFLVVAQPYSIFKDIHKLEPGNYMTVKPGGEMTVRTYWDATATDEAHELITEEDYIHEMIRLLKESVEYHMVADVPVSAFLSGGLDSSAVVSMMREIAPRKEIETFSTIFPGMGEYDEDRFARVVSKTKQTRHNTNAFNVSFLEDMEDIAWHLDEPFAVSSAYATYYLAKSTSRKTKVVLTGDGGDELFAGYLGYTNDSYLRRNSIRKCFEIGFRVLYMMANMFKLKNKTVTRLLSGMRSRSGSEGLCYSEQVAQNSLYSSGLVFSKGFFLEFISEWEKNLLARYYDYLPTTDRLLKKLFAEYKTRLVDEMLMKVDRMTMAHSLEARVPLLDNKIVEFAFRMPSVMKLHHSEKGYTTKYVLKRAMDNYLPKNIIHRRKQGFNIPIREWMQGRLLKDAEEIVREGLLLRSGVISTGSLERLIKLQSDKTHGHNNMLMALLAFETWVNAYQSRVGNVTFC